MTKTIQDKITGMNKRLNKQDNDIIHALQAVVEGVGELFGSNCEVVLHSLEDLSHSVVKIVNGHVTGRKVGSPLTDHGIEVLNRAGLLEKDVSNSYYTIQNDGRLLESISILIRNSEGKPISFMCINVDLSSPLLSCIERLLSPSDRPSKGMIEHFPLTVEDLVNQTLDTVMTHISGQREIPASKKNKAAVTQLYEKGIFKVTGAIDIAAKLMGISRYTVYNYIREAKWRGREVK